MMEEPKLNDKVKVIEKLTPFWKRYWEKEEKFRNEVAELEEEMSKAVSLSVDLEFFHVDGECVGVGASGIDDRKKFPLIRDSEFGD